MLSQACQRCWRRKQKCSRENPKCSECKRAGARCIPRVQGHVFGHSDQDQHNVQSTGSLIEYMKQRIAYLEGHTAINSNASTSATITTDSHDSAEVNETSVQDEAGRSSDTRVVNNAVHQVEYLSLSAMSGSGKHAPDDTDGSMTAKFIKEVLASAGARPDASFAAPGSTRTLTFKLSHVESQDHGLETDRLRSTALIACSLLGLCFPYTSTEICLQALSVSTRVEQDTVSIEMNRLLPEEFILLNLILGTGLMMSPWEKDMRGYRNNLIAASNALLPEIGAKATETVAVQCLTAQTVLSLYNPGAGPTWHLLGLALTKAISIGSHRQNKHGERAEVDENVPLLFWTLYSLDRTIALTMSRPFGIEDDDITLDLPDMPAHQSSNTNNEAIRGLYLWKVHHARLLYGWHREPNPDFNTCLANCEYWQDIYKEISQRIDWNVEKFISKMHKEAFEATIRKDELQLSCRALGQLLGLFWQTPISNPSKTRLREQILSEVPQVLDHLTQSVRRCVLTLTFLDGYDIFAAAIIYSDSVYELNNMLAFRLGIAQTRTITMAIDLLQNVSERFTGMGALKEVIWGFLSALEAKNDEYSQTNSNPTRQSRPDAILQHEIDRCNAPIPNNLIQLMNNRLLGS